MLLLGRKVLVEVGCCVFPIYLLRVFAEEILNEGQDEGVHQQRPVFFNALVGVFEYEVSSPSISALFGCLPLHIIRYLIPAPYTSLPKRLNCFVKEFVLVISPRIVRVKVLCALAPYRCGHASMTGRTNCSPV